MYENCKIYGPYKRKDNREHVIIIFPDKSRKTISYPKFLMEIKLNKKLKDNETIDHKDCDFSNNNWNNLEIKERYVHIQEDVLRNKEEKFICPICGIDFKLKGSKLSNAIQNRLKNKTGPFCSRSCAGKYSQKIQVGKIEPLEVINIIPTLIRNKNN